MAKRSKWDFYKDNAKEWRWRKTAPNKKIVASSNEGFKTKQGAKGNAEKSGYKGK